MDEMTPGNVTVTVLPANRVAKVPIGTSLHEAIQEAGIVLALPCGGQGRCGRCLVIVRRGRVRRRSVARLTPGRVVQGYAVACQTVVESDVMVFVPSQEELLARPEDLSEADKAAVDVVTCDHTAEPWIRKYHLVIDPPTLQDNTTDLDRLQRELSRQHGVAQVGTSLPVLRELARALRDADWEVTAVVEHGTWEDPQGVPRVVDVQAGDTTSRTLGLAIDIGTTSNVVYLTDMSTATLLDSASTYNGQIACGEDVISRIIYARREGGLDHLQQLVIVTINGLIDAVLQRQSADPSEVYAVTVAGNPTMIHLFLGLDPQNIRLEPYIPTMDNAVLVRGSDLGLHVNPEATVDCLPGVGAYVGADITAGVLRSRMSENRAITLFIDVGTNGEMVLGNQDWLISCACSAGPAFEGAGVASGMRATDGAIQEVWINPETSEPSVRTIGDASPRGICGSGMISLLGEMFITGVIDKSGHLNDSLDTQRVRSGPSGLEYVVAWGTDGNGNGEVAEDDGSAQDIVITEVDIQNLLRAKAAIYAGVQVLVNSVGLGLDDIEQVQIGGGFGKHIDVEKAIDIGLLVDVPWGRVTYLGNTSIQGAYLSLLCRDHRKLVTEIAQKMTYLELSADNQFMDAFTSALFLPHTDMTLFPSVSAKLAR